MESIEWSEFERVELRLGTVVRAEAFPDARKPALKVWVDFGEFGIRQTSAQVTVHYTTESILGMQVVGVLNFPAKRIAGFESQFLMCGFADSNGDVVLATSDKPAPNGAKLY